MTVVAYASDLHMKHNIDYDLGHFDITPDIVVLAGDVSAYPELWRQGIDQIRREFKGPILGVMGNHEYYGKRFPEDISLFREALKTDKKTFILEKDSIDLEGFRFLGTTMWSDYAKGRHLDSCLRGIGDYKMIDVDSRFGTAPKELVAQVLLEDHKKSLSWLERQFQKEDVPTVVITHHAPSFMSQAMRFAGSTTGGAFCTELFDKVKEWQPKLWIHGHLHDQVDYRIGRTRVIANPWGYDFEFNPKRFEYIEI